MSKAVLVMDMPERCDKCLLLLKIPQKDGLALCLARPKNGQEEYNPKHEKSWRPYWCPLRELPEKILEMESGDESRHRNTRARVKKQDEAPGVHIAEKYADRITRDFMKKSRV